MLIFETLITFLKDKAYRQLVLVTLMVILVGSIVIHKLEGWTWLDSIYFCIVTITTLGFGDFTPQTNAGKIFTIFYIIIGVIIILTFINCIHNHFNDVRLKRKHFEKHKKP